MTRFIHIPFTLLLTLLIFGCGRSRNEGETSNDKNATTASNDTIVITEAQFENGAMQLGKIVERPFPKMIRTTGRLDVPPQNKAIISAFSGGYIKETPLLIGDGVKKGQAVITLENPDYIKIQQDYLEMTEQLNYLKSEYDRQKTLVAEQVTSQKKFLKAESDYKQTLAMRNGLRKQLQLLNISPTAVEEGKITSVVTLYAPIEGSVTEVNVSKGTYVAPTDGIMEIINADHIHLELEVFEKDIMKIKKDQPIYFKIPEASEETFKAKVYLVGTSVEQKNRTVKVHGHLNDEAAHNFTVGMFVEAQIVIDSITSSALPDEAIVTSEDRSYVLLMTALGNGEYSFRKKEVQIGDSYNGFSELMNGEQFTEADSFLIKGGFNLVGWE